MVSRITCTLCIMRWYFSLFCVGLVQFLRHVYFAKNIENLLLQLIGPAIK